MKARSNLRFATLSLCLVFFTCWFMACSNQHSPGLEYPNTQISNVEDDFFGMLVQDPYRWLETPMDSSEDVKTWVESQNALTQQYLNTLPQRSAIKERLEALWQSQTVSTPIKAGDHYFYMANDGRQDQSAVYVKESLDGKGELLLDPNQWSDDGTVSVSQIEPSPNGKYLAYAIQDAGSDWRTFKFIDMSTKAELSDSIQWIKYSSLRWLKDGSGFFYSGFFDPADEALNNEYFNRRLYFHQMGTSQDQDELAFEGYGSPGWVAVCRVTEDGRYLIISYSDTYDREEPTHLIVKDLQNGRQHTIAKYHTKSFELGYVILGIQGQKLFFITSVGAPNNKVVSINMAEGQPDFLQWKDVIPGSEQNLNWANLRGDRLIAQYLVDVKSVAKVFNTSGEELHAIDMPGIGVASSFLGTNRDSETFFTFSSLNRPKSIYRYDVTKNEVSLYKGPDMTFDPDDFVVKQKFYASPDGTRIPMFIMHKKGLQLDGEAPVLLHGYGGFGVSLYPSFQTRWLSWVDMGGVFALANIRGGNEYGEAWHDAGRKEKKQNVFDDFIAGAEYLIDQGYTRSEKLAIAGESNGGLLIGAVINQRPDLFAAALPDVGVMDMLRFHKFNLGSSTIGEYGVSTNAEDFDYLIKYSPYHNIAEAGKYPAVMATTGSHDNNVLPGHTLKYIARLQKSQSLDQPILLRVEMRAGHFTGRSVSQLVDQYTDKWTFLSHALDMDLKH